VGVLMICCAPAAQAAAQPRLVIVPSQRTQAAHALGALADSLVKPMGDIAVVVPTAQYVQAAQMARLGPHLASGSAGAVLLGTQVGVSHALYLRASSQQVTVGKRKKRTRERLMVRATLVDTATGETLLSERYVASGRDLSGGALSTRLLADVKAALAAVPEPGVVAGRSQPAAADTAPAVAHGATEKAQEPAPSAPPVSVAAPKAARAEAVADAAPMAPAPTAGSSAMALGLRAQLGLSVFGRQATLSSLGVPKMRYGVGSNGPGPAFSRGTLQLEAFPVQMLRRHRTRKIYDGIGLHVGGALGWPKTRVSQNVIATSLISNLRTGLTLRYPFGPSPKSPEAAFRLGYSRYAFAMPQGAPFPSLSYSSVYLDVSGDVPLGTPKVALMAEAALMPALHVGNQGALLGVHRGGGVGAWVQAGLRISPVRHLDIYALFDWEHYAARFVGSTLLPNSSAQYASVTLKETVLGGRLAVGLRL
jgi:hypothetical protein